MANNKENPKLSEKVEANRKFLISSWSSCFPKRPPSNKQELYANAKDYYAKLNNGGIFTCSTGDLAACVHELKKIYKSSNPNTLLSSSRYDPHAASSGDITGTLDELGNELTRVATDYQNYLIKSVSLVVGSYINSKLSSIVAQNKEANAKLDKALALLRANNIDFDPNEFALGEFTVNKLDAALNNACLCEDSDCNCMADKSKQALKAVLKNVVPDLDQSVDRILKDLSNTTAEIVPKSVGKADKLPSEQTNLVAMPPKEQEMAPQAIKALDSLDNKSDSDLPQQTSMFIYIQTTPLQGQS